MSTRRKPFTSDFFFFLSSPLVRPSPPFLLPSLGLTRSRDKKTGEIVAMKIIDIESTEDDLQEIQQEVTFQSQCNDEHITRYLGSYIRGNELWIAMEFLGGGSVADLVRNPCDGVSCPPSSSDELPPSPPLVENLLNPGKLYSGCHQGCG